MINTAILLGRLTREPDMRTTQSGTPVASFTLAVDRGRRDESGQTQADFIPCVAWQKTAETIGRYVTKGQLIAVRGRIQTRRYKDRDGFDRTMTEVIVDEFSFAESRRQQADDGYAPQAAPVYAYSPAAAAPAYTAAGPTTQAPRPVAVQNTLEPEQPRYMSQRAPAESAWGSDGFSTLADDDSELPF